ncbi:hypothetical protein [Dysgonomonas massiliensis]|uniref:hypothetical protein n=1 Tax=Dysgonomonas massiliensis TaxID=2040292 RepID=UPI0011AEFD35|nr:hypothetical protein [Dysgonomonas massiliensis]
MKLLCRLCLQLVEWTQILIFNLKHHNAAYPIVEEGDRYLSFFESFDIESKSALANLNRD